LQAIAQDCRRSERERQDRVFFLESLERVDRIIREAKDVEGMLGEVLEAALSIFGSDRAWLLYPCDPQAPTFRVPMEKTRDQYPGALAMGVEIPLPPEAAEVLRTALAANAPVTYDSRSGRPVHFAEVFSTRSEINLALYPRLGAPWLLGMHQCSYARVWTDSDQVLFHEIGRRIADGLNSLLFLRDLQKSEERYRELIEGTSDLIVQLDSDGRIAFVNQLAGEIFGLPPMQCMSLPILDFIHTEDRERARTVFGSWVRTRTQSSTVELRHVRGDGGIKELLWNVNLHYDEHDRLLSIGGIGRDIGALKRAEQERLSLERQVLHAQKLDSLGVLAGGIAHDFNNILTGVLGNAELAMLRLTPESPARDYLRNVETAAVRAAELARQMLAYSGKGRFVVEAICLNRVVEEMAHLLAAVISKNVVLEIRLAEELPLVKADATQIRQVVMNLITNASEAIGDRDGTVMASTGVTEVTKGDLPETCLKEGLPEGRYVYVEVTDTGCGMDLEIQDKIFDPFFTTKFTGRGLGLAAALGIVRGHRGAIRLQSEPGKGTTFTILLPCFADTTKNASNQPVSLQPWSGQGTVLVADDEEMVRTIARRILEEAGFEVIEAQDGQEAVRIFEERSDGIIAVLLDMTMPHMSGDEAFSRMRSISPGIRIILSSGYSEQDATSRFAGKGLTGFLQKPYRSTELLQKLRGVLEGDG